MMAMGSTSQEEFDFALSCENYDTYPRNLLRTRDFPHALDAYSDQLEQGAKHASPTAVSYPVHFWDLQTRNDGAGELEYQHRSTKGLAELKTYISSREQLPLHRFIHVRSISSHDPTACSQDEIKMILTTHQVMASFVPFLLTFPGLNGFHRLTAFRSEDHLGFMIDQQGVQSQRFGQPKGRIQHCFNILGIQKNRMGDWDDRQIAVYHSFDAAEARAMWIVKKGDSSIRRRLERATRDTLSSRPEVALSFCRSFGQTLRDHLLILQWCTEGWEEYLETMEDSYRKTTVMARYPGVQELAEDDPKWRERKRNTLGTDRNTVNGLEDDGPEDQPATTTRWPLGRFRKPPHRPARPSRRQDAIKNKHLKLDGELFTNLQNLGECATKLENMMSRLEQSTRVIEDIRVRYHNLLRSRKFRRHIPKEEIEICLDYSDDFEAELHIIMSTLEAFRTRSKTILGHITHSGNIFNYLFQERSMYTAEYFAASTRDSADAMESMTENMQERTTSMHVVTMVTLIFLPGTFVATVFSSGILTFGEDGSGGFGSNMGDWKVRLAGLKLFFAVCIPLLCATFLVWFAAYRLARMQRIDNGKMLDEEKEGDSGQVRSALASGRTGKMSSAARKGFFRGRFMSEGIALADLSTPGGVPQPSGG